jgi:hypothetical protein
VTQALVVANMAPRPTVAAHFEKIRITLFPFAVARGRDPTRGQTLPHGRLFRTRFEWTMIEWL